MLLFFWPNSQGPQRLRALIQLPSLVHARLLPSLVHAKVANQSKHQQTATTVRAPTNYEVPAWHPTPVQCSAQKPPDMQIRLDSIYCPAECQLFPILGWLGSPFRVPRCRIQLFGWETATGWNQPSDRHAASPLLGAWAPTPQRPFGAAWKSSSRFDAVDFWAGEFS